MKISIITVTYNSAKTLADTLNSVLSQTYTNYEVIIVDGCSKDCTMDIVRNYEGVFAGRLSYISEPDQGIYDAMNKGIAMATGDIVGILNSDDFLYDTYVLQDIANTFRTQKTDCVFGNLVYVDAADTNIIKRIWKGSEYKDGKFRYGWVPAHPTFYVRHSCYRELGGYRLDFQVSADFELMLRYLAKHKISSTYIDRYFVRMRSGGESNGSLRNIYIGNSNIMRAFRENGLSAPLLYPVYRIIPKIAQMLKLKIMHKPQL